MKSKSSKTIRVVIFSMCVILLLASCGKNSVNNSSVENESSVTVVSSAENDVSDSTPPADKNENLYGNIQITKKYSVDKVFGEGVYSYEVFNDTYSGKNMNYRLHLPKNFDKNEKYPVVLFLHSSSGIGTNNEPLGSFENSFSAASDILDGAIIICPQSPTSWRIDDSMPNDKKGYLSIAKRIVDYAIDKYSGDKNRVYLTGVSLGGFATWDMLDAYPEYFAASVPVCGGSYGQISDSIVNTPIWLFHGTADPMVSYESSKSTFDAIIAAGGKEVKMTSLQGVDHSAGKHAYTNREMFSWMFSQNLKNQSPVKEGNITFIKVVSQNGDIVLTERDFTKSEFEIALGSCKISATIKSDASSRLKDLYSKNADAVYSVKIGQQTLYEFKFVSAPTDKFEVISTLEYTVFEGIYNKIK